MDTLAALQMFVRVAESGSFSAVARELGGSQSAVTRHVALLEDRFGVRLFHRTTRHLSVTEDGQVLLEHARLVLLASDGMEAALGSRQASPIGHVRLGVSTALSLLLTPCLPTLFKRHPNLSLELIVRDQFGDMIEERLDVVVRPGEIADSSVVARRLGLYRRLAVASPAYLASHAAPGHPRDLGAHDCVIHDYGQGHCNEWSFEGPEGTITVTVSGSLLSDNGEAAHSAVLSGVGVGMLPYGLVIDDIRSGALLPLLPGFPAQAYPAYLVYPSRRHLPPRTRVVIDFVLEQTDVLNRQIAAFYAAQADTGGRHLSASG